MTREQIEEHIDRILKIKIPKNPVLLVGENACGKSLIRQLAKNQCAEGTQTFHASMELRTVSNESMGALSGMAHDLQWRATSHNTFSVIKKVLQMSEKSTILHGVCVDEPEIGLGVAAQRGMAQWLIPELEKHTGKREFTILITHSIIFAKACADWSFIDASIEPTKDIKEWLAIQADIERVIPVEQLEERAQIMFEAVRDRLNKKRKK